MAMVLIEARSQKSIGSSNNKFGGPDRYVAIQLVPDCSSPLKSLQGPAARRRGIVLYTVGEGYRDHTGPRSKLGQARSDAEGLKKLLDRAITFWN